MGSKVIDYQAMAQVADAMEKAADRISLTTVRLLDEINAGPFAVKIAGIAAELAAVGLNLVLQLGMGAKLLRIALARYLEDEYGAARDLADLRHWLEEGA